MLCKVTKKMVTVLNRAAKIRAFSFGYREADIQTYKTSVNSNVWEAYDWGDYDAAKGKFKYIAVVYPADFLALPQYLTTKDLQRCFSPGMSFEEFVSVVCDAVEI